MQNSTQENNERQTFVRDIYDLFFFKTFKAPPAVWKFIRSFFHGVLRPGALDPRTDCGPENRYLSDVRLAQTLFSLSIASAVGNFISQDIKGVFDKTDPKLIVFILKYFFGFIQNSYLLWLFSSLLMAAVFLQRWWLRFTKADFLPRRESATLFIYEAGVLLLPLVVMMLIFEYRLFQEPNQKMINAFIIFGIFAVLHVFFFFFRLGSRAGLTIWKRTWTSLLLVYFSAVAWLAGMVITLPFIFLPFLLLMYPFWAVIRDYIPKPSPVRNFFAKVQKAIEP
jgi:hypothetical protein